MHTYRLLTDQAELDAVLVPVLELNCSEIPKAGCYAAAVEFDESGNLVGYLMLQNAVFLEGLWARDDSAHLKTLINMAIQHAIEALGAPPAMTMARKDETGTKVGRIAERLGYIKMNCDVFRRKR